MKKCLGCNAQRTELEFGTFKTCVICRKRQKEFRQSDLGKSKKKIYYEINKDNYRNYGLQYRRTLIGRFKKSKKSILKRGIVFDLTFEQYTDKVSKSCYYCQGYFPPVEAGSGLDRLEPAIGYTLDNCVSCCDTCNTIKNDILSSEETKIIIDIIVKMRKGKHV